MSKPESTGPSRRRLLAPLLVVVLAVAGAAVLAVRAQGTPAQSQSQSQSQPSSRASTQVPPLGSPLPTGATPARTDPLFVAFEGDPLAGQRVVMGASGAGIGAACFHCHGLQGEGDSGGAFPRLAGQPAYYLYKQLTAYADGTRPNDIMSPIALKLLEHERRDAAAYYAVARAPFRAPPGEDPQQLQRGAAIAAVGSQSRGIQSCFGCHGPGGTGVAPDIPYIAGLGAPYLDLQLRLWQEGRRTNDPQGVMADVARRLSPEERQSVSRYLAALQPPGP